MINSSEHAGEADPTWGLLDSYKKAVGRYRAAVEDLVAGRAAGKSVEEREALARQVEVARLNCEEHHLAVEKHRLEDYTRTSRIV